MKKTLFFVCMLMLAHNSNAQRRETPQQAAYSLEKVMADFQHHEQFRKSSIKRGYSNELDADIKKDSAQYYVGGGSKDTVFISKNGIGVSYDSAGTILYTDKRAYLLAGQMGLYFKDRQYGSIAGSTKTIWITFLSSDGYVSLPFTPDGDASYNVFTLAGDVVVDTNNVATTSFTNKNGNTVDKYDLIRGVGTALLVQLNTNSDFKEVADLVIGKPKASTAKVSTSSVPPAEKPKRQ